MLLQEAFSIFAKWSEIDFTTDVGIIPAAKAKNGFAHRVSLSRLASELLTEIKKINGDSRWLFPSERTSAPIRGQSVDYALRRCLHVFPDIKSFCVHDCRRTAATHMAGLRISGETLSRILNHAKKGVTEQKKHWENKIILNKKEEANIVQIIISLFI